LLDEVLRPDRLARGGVQAEEVAHGAHGVDLAPGHGRRRPRAGRVTDLVRAVVLVRPEHVARGLVEAEDALAAGDGIAGEEVIGVAGPLRHRAAGDVHAALGDGRPGVPPAQRRAPAGLEAVGGELVHDAGLAPDAVALRAEPLRPVVGTRHG